MIRAIALTAGLSLAALAGTARADDAPTPGPAAAQIPQLRALCTDRPTKSTSPCTVDPGHFQLESDIGNVTLDHSGGADTTTALYTDPTLKYGVNDTVDVELSLAPYETIVSRDRTTNLTTRNTGVGDLYLKLKWALAGAAGGDFGLAFVPFVKAPTAGGGVGNGAWEGGVIAPVAFNLPAGWSAVVDPEIDVLKNPVGGDRHLGVAGLISLSHPLSQTITGSVELWADQDNQPGGVIRQASADLGAAWIPAGDQALQFDGGVNFGLNSQTPAAQLYLGVSRRF